MKRDEQLLATVPIHPNEVTIDPSILPCLGTVKVPIFNSCCTVSILTTRKLFAGKGVNILDDRMFIRDKIFEAMAIEAPDDDNVLWRKVHVVKQMIVFSPAEILKGDMEIKDIAGVHL